MKSYWIKYGGPALFLSLALLSLGGCRENHEIGNLAVVLGAAVDPTDDGEIKVTIELAHRDGVNSEDQSVILAAAGSDWQDAIDKLEEKTDKQLYWGHMVLLVLGEAFTQAQINGYLKMFYTDQRLSPTIYVAMTSNSAEDIFSSRFGESVYVSEGIAERLALEQKKDPDLCFTIGEWMQAVYYHRTCGIVAALSKVEDKVRVNRKVIRYESQG